MTGLVSIAIILALFKCTYCYEVGNMFTEFKVEQGQGKYTVPVATPRGFPTHLLDLTLQYSNAAGNGPLGLGWSIGGLTQITRCAKTPAQDGHTRSVRYDRADQFCYEGSRLVLMSGTYGYDGSTYGTELDSYIRAYAKGSHGNGPQRFQIKSKGNQKMTFGSHANSRVFAHGEQSIHAWKLDSISDYSNNVVKVMYVDGTNGQLISRITHNHMSISFEYEARSDVSQLYLKGGVFYTQNKRVKAIKTFVGSHLHREIKIKYKSAKATQLSIISSLQLCSRGGKCYKPETFAYQATTDIERSSSPRYWLHDYGYNQGWRVNKHNRQLVDMNDDGLADVVGFADNGVMVALNQGSGSFERPRRWIHQYGSSSGGWGHQHPRFVVDVNGDHLPDIVGFANGGVYVAVNTGLQSFKDNRYWLRQFGYNQGWRVESHPRFVKDMNGDGLPDIVGFASDGVYVALGTGSSFQTSSRWVTGFGYSNGWRISKHPRFLEDVNGDGLPDIVGMANGGIYVSINDGKSATPGSLWGNGLFGYDGGWRTNQHPRFVIDVNGDGLADIVGFSCCGVEVSLSTGKSFLPSKTWLRQFSYNQGWRVENHPRFMQDINGDGLPDVVGIANSGVHVSLNTGSSSFMYMKLWVSQFGKATGGWSTSHHPRYLADVTGDGFVDIVGFASAGVYISTNSNKKTLMTSITDSYTNKHLISYSTLADKTIYTRGASASYPNPKVNIAQTVVKKFTQNNGIGGLNTTTFSYSGMRINLNGRGALGFSEITEKRIESTETVTTSFHQDFPLTSLSKSITKKVGSNVILQSSKSYNTRSANGQKQVLLKQDTVKYYELNGKLVRTEQLVIDSADNYGNIKVMRKITSGNGKSFEQRTSNNYTNNPHTWFIGELDSIAVSYHTTGTPTMVRRSIYYYDRTTRNLKYELREPTHYLGLKTSYVYDPKGNVVEKAETPIFPRSAGLTSIPRKVFMTFDSEGLRLLSVRNDYGHSESYTYDVYGNVKSFVGANGLKTTYTYDAFDRRIQEIRPDGVTTKMELYSSAHHTSLRRAVYVEKTTRTGDQDTLKIYDCLDRPIRITSIGFQSKQVNQDIEYDKFGRVRRQSLPYFPKSQSPSWIMFKYDKVGREVVEEKPLEGSGTVRTTKTYDGLEKVTVDAKGHKKVVEVDVLGRVVKVTDALGGTVRYEYDAIGNLVKTTDPAGHVTLMEYDQFGNKVSIDDPDMGIWKYSYDAHGQKIWQKDAVGNNIFFSYDKLGRMIEQRSPEGKTRWAYDQSPNGKGKLSKATSPDGHVIEYSYDTKGRQSTVRHYVDGKPFDVHSSYNNLGQLTQQTLPGNKKISYCYDSQGFMTEVSRQPCGQGTTPQSAYWRALDYDSFGHISKEQYGNSLLTDYKYDGSNHIKSIKTLDFSRRVKRHWEYKFDAVGNMIERRDFSHQWNTKEIFSYDTLDRITKANIQSMNKNKEATFSEDWEYDSIGNLKRYSGFGGLHHEYSRTQPHAVKRAGPYIYSYDANGNMVRKNNQHVTWTSFNKPRTIERKTRDNVKFEYDASQDRFKKTSPEETSIYIGKLYEKVTDLKKTTHKYFIYALGRLVAIDFKVQDELKSSSFIRYVHGDHLNSIDTVTDDRGNILESLRYNAYGQRRSAHWANFEGCTTHAQRGSVSTGTKRGFTGHEHLEELDLIHMNGRIYDPVVGRFLSPDPHIQDPYNTQSFNRYSYTLNNPLKHTDPTGYFFKKIGRFFKKIWKPLVAVVAVVASVVTAGAAAPIAASIVASVGLTGVTATVAAGALAGAAAGFVGGTIASGSIKGGLKGAIGGAITGGIGAHFGSTWNIERVATQAIGGGAASELSGGKFKDGFLLAGITASAQYLYRSVVNYKPTWKPGGPAQMKTQAQMPIEGANNIGIQGDTTDPSGWLNEGGRISRFLNKVPGINAVAGMHDVFQVKLDGAFFPGARDWLNVPGMIPAAAITGAALIDGPASQALLVEEKKKHR